MKLLAGFLSSATHVPDGVLEWATTSFTSVPVYSLNNHTLPHSVTFEVGEV